MRTLYRAASVHTFGHPSTGQWVLVDDRHVERVGTGEPPSSDRTVDLPGATIVPGFVDAHVHLTGTGVRVSRPEAGSVGSARELLDAAAALEPGTAGITFLHGFDESKWNRPELPSMAALDAVPTALIIARTDSHACMANTTALMQSGAIDMPGVERDAEGEPTGLVKERANDRLLQWFSDSLSEHEIEEFQLRAAALAAARGITSLHEMSMPRAHGARDLEILLEHKDRLPVDVIAYVATTDVGYALDLGLSRIGGDLALDGSIGARTAHLTQPYSGSSGTGVRYHEDDALLQFLHDAHVAGLQVGLHAVGDAAIEQAISCWEFVFQTLDSRQRRHFRARRHRIEHFEMPGGAQMERAAILGLAVSIQPAFDAEWGNHGQLYEERLGETRASQMNPFKTLQERGIEIGAGSDSPITAMDPMAGVSALEQHHDMSQRFSRQEALRSFTRGGARLARQEEKKGHLAPGTHADFAAYEADPLTADLAELRPVLTVSLGREVYVA